ncbi:hypothetical protein GCM10010451_39860 [Streptomyces virens]|uniref:Peptidase S8/S53 domain-containing protein n=1 Tax=Streptomyces virens TaxID=285572 RepID=A0ABP6PRI3_9ACTN|nr:S8 family serine peptidase [Streptomyces calvus]
MARHRVRGSPGGDLGHAEQTQTTPLRYGRAGRASDRCSHPGTGADVGAVGAYVGGQGAFDLASGAKILPIRMPKAETAANKAEGSGGSTRLPAPQTIRYAVDAGARVINISIVAAVGNKGDSTNEVEYPAATPGVIGVAAVGKDLHRTAESQYGPQVDMAAPGEDPLHACEQRPIPSRSIGFAPPPYSAPGVPGSVTLPDRVPGCA